MIATVYPSHIYGAVTAPASKSAMQRACAAALIKGGKTVLKNPGTSADDRAALQIVRDLGADVQTSDDTVVITSNGIHPIRNQIHAGESGLSVRMFTPIAAVADQAIEVTGAGSLLNRPLTFFDEVLPKVGVQCSSSNGVLPLQVHGPLQPADIVVDGSLSSQFLTGLLYSYSAANASDVTVRVTNLNSKPYIDLTLQVMDAFGLKTPINRDYKEFYFPATSATSFESNNIVYQVEGDWSGGAFLLVAAALAGDVSIAGLDLFSSQADKAIYFVLKSCGVEIVHTEEMMLVKKCDNLQSFQFDATDCPDLFPPLVSLASCCAGESRIAGVHRLKHKESDRAATLQEEFGKLGITAKIIGDEMFIKGAQITSANVTSHHDHRIAMACAVAALRSDGPVVIEHAEAVNKSYPMFWSHLKQLHVAVTLSDNK